MEENIPRSWIDLEIEKGWKRGRSEGHSEGLLQGVATLLLRQLRRKFGAIPKKLEDYVLSSDLNEMDTWGKELLYAKSLEDLFPDFTFKD